MNLFILTFKIILYFVYVLIILCILWKKCFVNNVSWPRQQLGHHVVTCNWWRTLSFVLTKRVQVIRRNGLLATPNLLVGGAHGMDIYVCKLCFESIIILCDKLSKTIHRYDGFTDVCLPPCILLQCSRWSWAFVRQKIL